MLALWSLELQSQRLLQGAAQFGERGQAGMFVHPRQRVAGIGRKEERDILRLSQWRLVQQHAFQKFGEAGGLADGAAWTARQRKECSRVVALEAEAFPPLCLAPCVAAQQLEVAVVGNQHQPVGIKIAAHLGTA
ncbi:hypothetical protein [Rhodopila sp.]|uniref:hypothetical protein n=1 Tax=Rhodopila sp. TaxID=2480087 RepID=UPI003D111830